MAASKRRTPHRLDLRWQFRNKDGLAPGAGGGSPGGTDALRHEETFTSPEGGNYAIVVHSFGVSPGVSILFDSSGNELEIAWRDDLAGVFEELTFTTALTDATVILEAAPEERFSETFTATSTYLVTHDLGATPSSVVVYDWDGRELEVAWEDTSVDSTTLTFNGTISGGTVYVEACTDFRHDATFTSASPYRVTHSFGVSPGAVTLLDSNGDELMVAWQDDLAGVYTDISFNGGTLTNARVLLSAVDLS